jgi:hypothetical protein
MQTDRTATSRSASIDAPKTATSDESTPLPFNRKRRMEPRRKAVAGPRPEPHHDQPPVPFPLPPMANYQPTGTANLSSPLTPGRPTWTFPQSTASILPQSALGSLPPAPPSLPPKPPTPLPVHFRHNRNDTTPISGFRYPMHQDPMLPRLSPLEDMSPMGFPAVRCEQAGHPPVLPQVYAPYPPQGQHPPYPPQGYPPYHPQGHPAFHQQGPPSFPPQEPRPWEQ